MAFEHRVLQANLPRTEKLFHRDVSLIETTALVLEAQGEYVVLDRTIFYAESGGQDFDTGTIDGLRVVDVQEQGGRLLQARGARVEIPAVEVDAVIVHKLERPAEFRAGQRVALVVDGGRRKKLMRSHSAAHFIFHAARLILGGEDDPAFVKGCHVAEDGCRFDFARDCARETTADIETLTNELIASGGPIRMVPSEASDEVFYWIWKDVVIPCGGTHVEDASLVPRVSLSRSKKGSNLTRVKAGFKIEAPS